MFISTHNEFLQFVSAILAAGTTKELTNLLHSQDEKQLSYAKNTMIQKMPRELHPHSSPSPQATHSFPSMFQSTNRKTYEYIDQNLQNMKHVSNSYCHPRIDPFKHTLLPTIEERSKVEGDPSAEIEADDEAKMPEQGGAMADKSQRIKSSNSQLSLSFNQAKPTKNPFVPNNINFTDKYANSKALEHKYQHLTFTENSRNIAAMAQTAKYSAFSHSVAFPTTVMAGTLLPPKENTFSRESKLDVEDVMRYTLGVKRTSVSKGEADNPFWRVPKRRG